MATFEKATWKDFDAKLPSVIVKKIESVLYDTKHHYYFVTLKSGAVLGKHAIEYLSNSNRWYWFEGVAVQKGKLQLAIKVS